MLGSKIPTTASPHPPSTLQSLFGYKAWANDELFAALATVDVQKHPAETHTAMRILNHVYVVDCIFKAHLTGSAHDYAAAVKETDAWFMAYVNTLPEAFLQEQVRFVFTDGDGGMMSREEILLHVATHGGYHRGAAGQAMRSAAVAPPRDLYTRFLHLAELGRRVGLGKPD